MVKTNNPKDKVGITLNRQTWKELSKIRIENDFKTLDDLIKYLLLKYYKK